jgi:hypothetical protein
VGAVGAVGAVGEVRAVGGRARRTCDVQVRPRDVAHERLEEQRRRHPARIAAGVVGVGHRRLDQVPVLVRQRHPPQRLAGTGAGIAQRRGQLVVGGEQPAQPKAQRHLHRAGQRGDVDDDARIEAGRRVGQRVGEDEPALGVGVPDD